MTRSFSSSIIWSLTFAFVYLNCAAAMLLWAAGVGSATGAGEAALRVMAPPYGVWRGFEAVHWFINNPTKVTTCGKDSQAGQR